MAKQIVHCRICKNEIDKDNDDWVMPSRNWYYHKECYENWRKKESELTAVANDEEWFGLMWTYLTREIRFPANYQKIKKQWDSFLKKNMTAKGIFFGVKYIYDIKRIDFEKADGGIGLLPYIYIESAEYWQKKENSNRGICNKIVAQLKAQMEQEKITVKQVKKNKRTTKYSLDDVLGMENLE